MANPMINEGPLAKVRTKIGKKKEEEMSKTGTIDGYIIGFNPAVDICADASAICWDKPLPEGYDNLAEYVAKRTRVGHTSVLEHSNCVMLLDIASCFANDLIAFLDCCHYVYTRVTTSTDGERFYLLIGGSYRAYSDIYRETDDLNNIILKHVTNILYTYSHSAMFEDICRLGLMDKSKFMNIEPDPDMYLSAPYTEDHNTDRFDVINCDDISILYNKIYSVHPDAASTFTTYDLLKFCTVTINFKNMSRIITQQLTRHRNGITQESQRYVDYSNFAFNSPALFKDKYDENHKYSINFGASGRLNMTLQEIGEAICGIYGTLVNKAATSEKFVLNREDARGFLPCNVICRKLYMTFTYKSLLKFLLLREDKAAQAEIRAYAQDIADWFERETPFTTKEIRDLYTNPRLSIGESIKIDVDEGIHEEVHDMTEEDYINYMKQVEAAETKEEENGNADSE